MIFIIRFPGIWKVQVFDDFHYTLSRYMEGTGITVEPEEPASIEQELSGIEQFLEDKFEWEEEEEEEEEEEIDEAEKQLLDIEKQYEEYYKDLLS